MTAPGESEPTILTCRACVVDVSVSRDAARVCPRCGGELDRPSQVEGDVQERTLHEAKLLVPLSDSLLPPLSPEALAAARAAARDELKDLAETNTQDGAPPSLVRAGIVREALSPEPVRKLGQYELRRVLGKGGMGVVYEAWQPSLGRAVALKVMSSTDTSGEEQERFTREARAAAKLQHPNIVPVYDVGSFEGRSYFTMDLVRGRTLQELARSGGLQPLDAARLVSRVARAIHYAHERGIIHRDLKPSNVLVDEQGEPHVTDFGLAKDVTDDTGLTLTGVAMGSPPYMPPEQARGEFRRVDAVSDVYGLGTILYECLTGAPPFQGKSVYDVIAKVLVEEPVPPRRKNPAAPVDVETVCLKALEKEKWRRYPTAEGMAEDLDRVLAGRTIQAVRQGLTTRIGRGLERHRWQIVSALVPAAVVVALAGYFLGGQPQRTPGSSPGVVQDDRGGAIALAGQEVHRAVVHLRELGGPTWRDLDSSLRDHVPGGAPAVEALRGRVERRAADPTEGREPVPGEDLAKLVDALVRDPELSHEDLATLIGAWYGVDDLVSEVAVSAVLAHRGAALHDPSAYRHALQGQPTPIDPLIVRDAAQGLAPRFAHLRREDRTAAAVAAVTSDRVLAEVALRRELPTLDRSRAAVQGAWTFPPVSWPGAPRAGGAPRPLAQGLLGAGRTDGEGLGTPTAALLTGDGARVLVAWLRFLHVLDEATGAVLRRVRLPGAARALSWDASGDDRVRVRVWDGAALRDVLVRVGETAAEDLLAWAVTDRQPPLDVRAIDLLPEGDAPARDELRRVACAVLPELDDRLDHLEESVTGAGARELRVRRTLRLAGRARLGLTLGLADGPDEGLCVFVGPGAWKHAVASRVTEVVERGPAALAGLRPGDVLLRIDAPTSRSLELRVLRADAAGRPVEARVVVQPDWAPVDWAAVAARAEEAAQRDPDPNPWLQAFAAAGWARRKDAPDAERAGALAFAAAGSPHLSPWERVELGCLLDRHGLFLPAESAFTVALTALLRDHGYAPDLAGYGRDAGRAIADRVELSRLERPERAPELVRWREAFAPALAESEHARGAYLRRRGLELPPAAPGEKGLAGLDALDVLRLDHAIRLQVVLITFTGVLLVVLLVRYRRHAIRDLDRLLVRGPVSRWALWLRRPWTRLTFTWPTYITLSDKLGFIVLYLVYFLALSVQDAGFDVLAALRRGHEGMLSGLPASAPSMRALTRVDPGEEPDAPRAYALLWGLLARQDVDERRRAATLGPGAERLLDACADALRTRGLPRDHLLLAEWKLAAGDQPPGTTVADSLRLASADPALAPVARYLAGDASVAPTLGERSPRQQRALQFLDGEPARPLAPPPTPGERDELVVGRRRWWSAVPGYLLRNMTQPTHGTVDASLLAFEEAWSLNLEFARLRSNYFFLVPASVLVLVLALVVRTPRWFEPLASDLRPPLGVRLLSLMVPGVPQVMRGRTVRGVLLLAPFTYVAQTLYNARQGYLLLGWLREFARFDDREIATLTAESAVAIEEISAAHAVELVLVLAGLYVLHWLDLALQRRRVARSGAERPRPVIVPVDSEVGLPPPSRAPLPPSAAAEPGPFDRTGPGPPTPRP